MKWIRIVYLTVFLLGVFSIRAQNTEGTEFWLTFGINTYSSPDSLDLQICIVGGENPASGTIHFTNLGSSINFNLSALQIFTYILTDNQKKAAFNTMMGKTNYSIHITTDESVVVYAMNQARKSNDVTNILPVTALGSDYYQISYIPSNEFPTNNLDAYAVVATQNNTHLFHNGVLVTTLNLGEVYSELLAPI